MFPSFILFGKEIGMYAVMAIIGLFAAGIFMCYLTRKRGLDDNDTIIILLFAAIGVLVGGHILYGITNIKLIPLIFKAASFKEFISNVGYVFGGAVFYGGLFGGLAVGFLVLKIKKLNMPVFSDMAAVIIPLFHSFARVGCFLGGCCYGIESEFGFTAHGNHLVPDLNDVSRFPVQLLEAVLNLLLFLLLYFIYKRSLKCEFLKGKILLIYLFLYSIIRFCDEFLRGDKIRGFIFGISTSQFISVILFVISATALTVSLIRNKKNCEDKM